MNGINKREYLKTLFQPWNYVNGPEIETLQNKLAVMYGVDKSQIFLTGNGRAAQYLFLKSLNLDSTSNVVMQGYTCNAAVGPNLWLGLQVKYVDINPDTYCMDFESLKKTVDENTKVIIVQHTYGIPAEVDKIVQFAKSKGIYVFEDCAHGFGFEYDNASAGQITGPLGTRASASLISFGIDKVLNTRVGGALLINDKTLLDGVEKEYVQFKPIGFIDTKIWLLNPFIWFLLAKFRGARKDIAKMFTRLGILNMGFYSCEFKPQMPKQYPRRISNALAWFVNQEIAHLSENIANRLAVVKLYEKAFDGAFGGINGVSGSVEFKQWRIPMVKFPILLPSREVRNMVYEKLMAKGFLVSKWYDPVIFPEGNGLNTWGYRPGTAPVSEKVSERILALPTGFNVNEKSVIEIIAVIKGAVAEKNI